MSTSHPRTEFVLPTKFRIGAVVAVLIAACTHLLNTGYADWHAGADTAYVLLLHLLDQEGRIGMGDRHPLHPPPGDVHHG